MHTQRGLSSQIINAGGNYLWIVEGNQPKTQEAIEQLFASQKRVPVLVCPSGDGSLANPDISKCERDSLSQRTDRLLPPGWNTRRRLFGRAERFCCLWETDGKNFAAYGERGCDRRCVFRPSIVHDIQRRAMSITLKQICTVVCATHRLL